MATRKALTKEAEMKDIARNFVISGQIHSVGYTANGMVMYSGVGHNRRHANGY